MDLRQEKSRLKLQQALMELLETKTLESISIEEIARTAGVTRPTFYANYADRQSLVRDCLEQQLQAAQKVYAEHESDDHLPPVERLAKFFSYLLGNTQSEARIWRLALRGRAGEAALAAVQQSTATMIRLRAQHAALDMDENELRLVSVFYGAAINAAIDAYMKGEITTDRETLAREMADLVGRGTGHRLGR